MFNKLICFIFIICICIPDAGCFGSPFYDADSLNIKLSEQEGDTCKLATLLLLIRELKQSDPEQAGSYCDQMYDLSVKLGYLPGIIDVLTEKAGLLAVSGEKDTAILLCEKAIQLSDSLHDTARLTRTYRELGKIMFFAEGPTSAFEYYKSSMSLCEKAEDDVGLASSLNGVAAVFLEQANYDSAVYYYLKMFRICEKKYLDEILLKGYINIGTAYNNLLDFDKAGHYFSESILLSEKLNKPINLSQGYNNLGNTLYNKKDYDSAWILYNKAIDLSKKHDYHIGVGDGYIGLGNISELNEKYDQAIQYFALAKSHYKNAHYKHGLLVVYKNEGLIHASLGNYDKTLAIYDTCLTIAKEMGLLYRIKETYLSIYKTYESKGDYRNAFKNLLIYNRVNDSIFNIEKEKTKAEFEIKYQLEKKQSENLALKNDILVKDLDLKRSTNQRNIYLFTGSGIVVMLVFIISFYIQRSRKQRIITQHKIQRLEEEKKLLAARSIVEGQEEERKRIATELHDGLGVLLSSAKIQFSSLKNKTPENAALIDRASGLLEQATSDVRRISHNMMPGLLTKFGFFEAVEEFFDQVDEAENLHARVIIEGEKSRLSENTEIMLYRIIQEMVNNSLKHAGAENLNLYIGINGDHLLVNYSDDGTGFDFNKMLKSKSIGLTSIRSRIKFLNGDLEFRSEPGAGVNYTFQVPIEKIYEDVEV